MQIKSILNRRKYQYSSERYSGAKDASNQAVEDGLSAAKNTKTTTSKENQNILADFSAKLPYTRLGSMEYTQAYQFIAKPVALNDVSKERKR